MSSCPSSSLPGLRALQAQLHRIRAEHSALCAALPLSTEPLPGWTSQDGRYFLRGDVPPSPGYTQEVPPGRLERRLRRLTGVVGTGAFWQSVEREKVVAARMALKRAHEPAAG
ncbi:hypothetical protein [Streptomyces sp. NPDC048269]|uniref:hypothetical protein n=1 Tax=Streptomyces sp. NPDC048269 TaxID=3155753 RepID=UPI003411F861